MSELNYEKITELMRQARREHNYTLHQVANDLHCTTAFISNVERNRVKVNLRILNYYSQMFNIPLDAVFNTKNTSSIDFSIKLPETESELNIELMEIFNTYSIQEKKKIIDILKLWKSNSPTTTQD